MIDHLSFAVKNFAQSAAFYDATLKILGYERIHTFEFPEYQGIGYGKDGKAAFWIGVEKNANMNEQIGSARGFHVSFQAPSADAIDKWHAKCLELAAKDNGAPGPRKEYHPGYYGAFVVDPNGWRLEAVIHTYGSKKH